jgi:hypothetical protein
MDRANREIRRYLAFSANSLSLLSASSASLRSGASRYAGETKQDDRGEMLERHVGLADKDGQEQELCLANPAGPVDLTWSP